MYLLEKIMQKTIEISSNTYERLGKLAQTFETPQDVITRLLDSCEKVGSKIENNRIVNEATSILRNEPQNVRRYNKLDINFFPPDLDQFKTLLLERNLAWVLLHMVDGSKKLHQWNTSRFSETSDVLGNLRSGYLRDWRDKGIISADIAIDKNDIDAN